MVPQTWQNPAMTCDYALHLTSHAPEDTAAIAARLGAGLGAGDVVLLSGPVGAGKSLFARALIQARLAELGRFEDVPSPSFTLVQTYDLDDVTLWHADLYRLGDPQDYVELGLDEAFEDAICVIEWADRLGPLTPPGALHLTLTPGEGADTRHLMFHSRNADWRARIAALAEGERHGG